MADDKLKLVFVADSTMFDEDFVVKKESISMIVAATLTGLPTICNAGPVVGVVQGGNCIPFTCPSLGDDIAQYQQVYAASAFGSSLTVDSVTFFQQVGASGSMDSATFAVRFYLTSFAPNGLTSIAAINRGILLANFGTFSLSGPVPAELTLDGGNFFFDPTLGNLLMEVDVLSVTSSLGGDRSLAADYPGSVTSRYFSFSSDSAGTGHTDIGGLVTRFDEVVAVPEPDTAALAIFGLVLILIGTRKARIKTPSADLLAAPTLGLKPTADLRSV